MAAVNVTLVGSAYIDGSATAVPVTIVAEAYYTDLTVGGGPIIPEPPVEPPVCDPHPEHPIVLPPDKPDVPPPSIWPGPGDPDFPAGPHPEHPIVIPPPIDGGELPIEPGSLIEWHAVWTPDRGWFVVGIPQVPHPAPSAT